MDEYKKTALGILLTKGDISDREFFDTLNDELIARNRQRLEQMRRAGNLVTKVLSHPRILWQRAQDFLAPPTTGPQFRACVSDLEKENMIISHLEKGWLHSPVKMRYYRITPVGKNALKQATVA